ncbi:MAG: ATP-binding cassette domain-containing protein [Rhodospirillales bacterium]
MSGLSVRGLTLARPGSRGTVPLLQDVSFSAPAGVVTAVLGAAGAGKTTLLACVAGLVKTDSGSVLVDGTEVAARRGGRRGIGMLAPGTDLGAGRTVTAALRVAAGRGRAEAAAEAVRLLGLEIAATRKLRELSHGQGFAALAAARLLVPGSVVLVDEAGEGLDDAAAEALWCWLRADAGGGRTLVLATRRAATAMQASHLVLLRHGTVVQAGPPCAVYAEPRDRVAALLTGPANILEGTVRQKVPGGFVWAAGGGQFRQEAPPDAPVPALATQVMLCLRPEALLVTEPEAAPSAGAGAALNRLSGVVCEGAPDGLTAVVDTKLGQLRARLPGPRGLCAGQAVELAWSPRAAHLLMPCLA